MKEVGFEAVGMSHFVPTSVCERPSGCVTCNLDWSTTLLGGCAMPVIYCVLRNVLCSWSLQKTFIDSRDFSIDSRDFYLEDIVSLNFLILILDS